VVAGFLSVGRLSRLQKRLRVSGRKPYKTGFPKMKWEGLGGPSVSLGGSTEAIQKGGTLIPWDRTNTSSAQGGTIFSGTLYSDSRCYCVEHNGGKDEVPLQE